MSTKLRKDNQIIYGKEIFTLQKFKQSRFQTMAKITGTWLPGGMIEDAYAHWVAIIATLQHSESRDL